MATVKLFHEKRDKTKNKNGEFPVYVRISHGGNKRERSLREFVFEKNWVDRDQRIQGKGHKTLNDKIQKVKGELIALILDLEKNDIEPTPSVVLSQYDELKKTQYSINIVNKTYDGWKKSLDNWFHYTEEHNKSGTIDNSRQFKNKFIAFAKSKRVPIKLLVDIDFKVSNKFRDYLYSDGLSYNTVGKHIARLRAWLRHESKMNNTEISNTQKFNSNQVAKSYVALSVEEIEQLIRYKFRKAQLAKARDIFIAITFTGLRISDYGRLNASLIENDVLNLRPIKTESSAASDRTIPLLKEVKEVLKRNNGQFPKLSEVKLREYLKDACKEVGFDQLVEVSTKKTDSYTKNEFVPKYKKITPHTGLKSLANYLKSKGLPTDFLAEFMNKSPKTLKKHYLRETTTNEMKDKLREHGLT